MSKVAKKVADKDIKKTISDVVADIGGFDNYIKTGDVVFIKPNYNTSDPTPASTAPDFLKAVVELVYEAGASRVIAGDSSTLSFKNHTASTRKYLTNAKVYELEKLDKAPEIMIFDEHKWVKKVIPNGKYLKSVKIPKILDEVDKIILLPVAKTHFVTSFTGSLKLAIGFMYPPERVRLHMGNVSEKVAEMNTIYTPDLIIMDARKCFISGGPCEGEVREPGFVLASKDRVAIDIEEIKIIQSFEGNSLAGIDPEEMIQIKLAKELGIK